MVTLWFKKGGPTSTMSQLWPTVSRWITSHSCWIHRTGSMTKYGENCKTLAQKSIKIAKDKFDCVVTCVVTDNARNMDKMRDGLKEDDCSLVVCGCSVHMLNLLGQDTTPSSVMKHVMKIQKYFRNHHKLNTWLIECPDTVKPRLPIETRWYRVN